jgi:hypothetical protein
VKQLSEKKTYYWLGSYPLESGSIVLPGNWGRITQIQGFSANCCMEFIFETVRLESFAEKPSRLKSLFLCETIDGIRKFQQATGRIIDILYEVEIVDPEPLVFRTDWSFASTQSNLPVRQIIDFAKTYWLGLSAGNHEILTTSKIRILRRIEE